MNKLAILIATGIGASAMFLASTLLSDTNVSGKGIAFIDRQSEEIERERENRRELRELREREERERHRDRDHRHEHEGHRQAVEKIEHLRAAAEHLDHAGMGELADKLRQQSERMEREVHHHRERQGDRRQHEVHKAIEQLRGEVRRLHAEVRELHERLDRDDDDDEARDGDKEDREEEFENERGDEK